MKVIRYLLCLGLAAPAIHADVKSKIRFTSRSKDHITVKIQTGSTEVKDPQQKQIMESQSCDLNIKNLKLGGANATASTDNDANTTEWVIPVGKKVVNIFWQYQQNGDIYKVNIDREPEKTQPGPNGQFTIFAPGIYHSNFADYAGTALKPALRPYTGPINQECDYPERQGASL